MQKKKPNMLTVGRSTSATFALPVYTDTHTHTYTYIHIHTHTYTYIYIHIHTYTYIYDKNYLPTCLPTYLPTYIYTSMHARTHACMHTHIHIHTHVHTHIYTYKCSTWYRHILHPHSRKRVRCGSGLMQLSQRAFFWNMPIALASGKEARPTGENR